ncbi:unnamed protein product [Dracunculus medinensis]|uniref:DNA_mis_repair domain-containing protein n=1 Tax=Dracunculus medinensis TaxID=318479 RepID=A0A0N4U910_DRAME|nr:unnamed protein product [Dracunculus medinensis]
MCVEVSRSTIRIISSDVRHRICAGQIVITLSGACKELIENALDANATVIEIRIKSFGVISLEVIDNGSGIHSFDFDSLCKPHATSKLSSLSDFNRLVTLGFRGEALNALCALSSVIIITRHALEKVGTKLVFDGNLKFIFCGQFFFKIGTTVIINNLFETLPVRRKELERSGKKEFTKLLYAIQSFALCRNDVRFLVNNDNNGKHFQILVTPGEKASITDVMISMFGVRVNKSSLLEIVRRVPDESIFSLYGVSEKQCHTIDIIKIHGFISSCMHGQGRSSTDRQFVYFNKRPVDYPKLCKIANEVYQTYNQGQYCIFILFIEVPPEYLDVNISPDKRSVFFEYEKELFALLRSSLLATFEPVLGCTQSLNDRSKNYQSENSSDTFFIKFLYHLCSISDSSFDLNDDVRRYTRTQQSLKFSMSFLRKRLQKVPNRCSKNDFGLMEIIGQFNKGFIIVRLRDELFIVDQHASDEIYNFERFQKRAKIQTQRLISPQTLDIGSVRESVLRDNMEIFNYNGFNFSFNDKFLHNWQFNTSDIDEMLAVLSEFPGIMYRPVKLRRLFASRACRKSIMIGTALNTSQMEKIIRHLGRLDQPWNCPHGRPTLRHLCTIHYRSNSEVGSCSAPHEK